jgi:hypothetical protein
MLSSTTAARSTPAHLARRGCGLLITVRYVPLAQLVLSLSRFMVHDTSEARRPWHPSRWPRCALAPRPVLRKRPSRASSASAVRRCISTCGRERVRAWLSLYDSDPAQAALCSESAPGGAFLWPEHTPRATRPENPSTLRVSGPHGLCIHAEASAETRSYRQADRSHHTESPGGGMPRVGICHPPQAGGARSWRARRS